MNTLLRIWGAIEFQGLSKGINESGAHCFVDKWGQSKQRNMVGEIVFRRA